MKKKRAGFKCLGVLGVKATSLMCGFVVALCTGGCSVISGDSALDGILRAIEKSDKAGDNFIHTLASRDEIIDSGTSVTRGCVDVVFPNGGRGRVCGPNTDTIVSNCPGRGWDCKRVDATRLLSVVTLTAVPQFDSWQELEIKTTFEDDDVATLMLRPESAGSAAFGCSYVGTLGEDFCVLSAEEEGCTGCTSTVENGVGVINCPDCCQCSRAVSAPKGAKDYRGR